MEVRQGAEKSKRVVISLPMSLTVAFSMTLSLLQVKRVI